MASVSRFGRSHLGRIGSMMHREGVTGAPAVLWKSSGGGLRGTGLMESAGSQQIRTMTWMNNMFFDKKNFNPPYQPMYYQVPNLPAEDDPGIPEWYRKGYIQRAKVWLPWHHYWYVWILTPPALYMLFW